MLVIWWQNCGTSIVIEHSCGLCKVYAEYVLALVILRRMRRRVTIVILSVCIGVGTMGTPGAGAPLCFRIVI
jgi:hypothetical protein